MIKVPVFCEEMKFYYSDYKNYYYLPHEDMAIHKSVSMYVDPAFKCGLYLGRYPYVRKLAHVTEYFLLAASVSLPLYVYRIRGIALTIVAGIFCISCAYLDEYFQSFIAGRVSSTRDVLIDCIGIVLGILIVRICGYIGRKTVFSFLSLEDTER